MEFLAKFLERAAPGALPYVYFAAFLALLIAAFVRVYIFTRDQRQDTSELMERVAGVEKRIDELETARDQFAIIAEQTSERLDQIHTDVREMPRMIAALINAAARRD